MGDSLCDMFLKEHEKYFPVHAVIQASTVKPKTPYQLDLETKDRKPSIIPKVGDRVKIKSLEWYEKWKDEDEDVNFSSLPNFFAKGMKKYCGKIVTISDEFGFGFELCEDDKPQVWLPEFFEEVYPVQELISSKFPKIDLNSPYLHQSPYEVNGSELVLSEEEQERLKDQFFPPCSEREKVLLKKQPFFSSKIGETAKRLSAYTLIQGLDDKPKLKQVKTTHLIKLKKL